MNFYTLLAKQAVENYIKEEKIISLPSDLPEEFLHRKSGTFVTVMRNDELRGCIGTYLPIRENIAEEIIYNAVAAATEDYRFGLIQEEELPYLSYIVYILNKPELVKDTNELDPKKFGIIVKTAPILDSRPFGRGSPFGAAKRSEVIFDGINPLKSGLLLPDLEGVDTVEQQISIACQKAGIDPEKEKTIIYKFTVEKYTKND